jgi:type I restriction enzyme, S subunit
MRYLPILDLVEQSFSGEWGTEPSEEPKIKVIRNTNFTNEGKLNLNDVVERSIPKNKILLKSLKYGDIIIEKSGGSPNQPVGRVVFYDQKDGEYLFSNFTSALRLKNEVNSRYFFYILFAHHCFKTTLSYQNKTTGILNLQLTRYLKETKIPLPSLETQKKIAAILDKADELRHNYMMIIEKYDQLAQSVFLEMFGDPVINNKNWEIESLGNVCEVIMGQSPNGNTYNNTGNGTPLLNGPTEFNEKYPKEKQWTTSPKKVCKKNDILFCVRGATAGRMNIANKEYCIGRGLAAIRSKGVMSEDYIYQILKIRYKIFQDTSNGSTFINISKDDLSSVAIPVTPLKIQEKYVAIIENIEEQKRLTISSHKKSKDLFQSMLQRAFRGELV